MSISFFEVMPRELQQNILSLLTPKELLQKCFPLDRAFKVGAALHLLHRGEEAKFAQQDFLKHCLENPEKCTYLHECSEDMVRVLTNLIRQPYLSSEMHYLIVFNRFVFGPKRALNSDDQSNLKRLFCDAKEGEHRWIYLFITSMARSLTSEQAAEIFQYVTPFLSAHLTDYKTEKAAEAAMKALLQQQSMDCRLHAIMALLNHKDWVVHQKLWCFVRLWASAFSREQRDTLFEVIMEPKIDHIRVIKALALASTALLRQENTDSRFSRLLVLLEHPCYQVRKEHYVSLQAWVLSFHEEQRKALWNVINKNVSDEVRSVEEEALKVMSLLLSQQSIDIQFDTLIDQLHSRSVSKEKRIAACRYIANWAQNFSLVQQNILWSHIERLLPDNYSEKEVIEKALQALLQQQNAENRLRTLQSWLEGQDNFFYGVACRYLSAQFSDFNEKQRSALYQRITTNPLRDDSPYALAALIALSANLDITTRLGRLKSWLKDIGPEYWLSRKRVLECLADWAQEMNAELCKANLLLIQKFFCSDNAEICKVAALAFKAVLQNQTPDMRFETLQHLLSLPGYLFTEVICQCIAAWAPEFREEQLKKFLEDLKRLFNTTSGDIIQAAVMAFRTVLNEQSLDFRFDSVVLMLKHQHYEVRRQAYSCIVSWASAFSDKQQRALWPLPEKGLESTERDETLEATCALKALYPHLPEQQRLEYLATLKAGLEAPRNIQEKKHLYRVLASISPCLGKANLQEWQAFLPSLIHGICSIDYHVGEYSKRAIHSIISLDVHAVNQGIQAQIISLLQEPERHIRYNLTDIAAYLFEFGFTCFGEATPLNEETRKPRAIQNIYRSLGSVNPKSDERVMPRPY